MYYMWSFSLFSKSHIGQVNHGKSENISWCRCFDNFFCGDAVFLSIFCGVAVFSTPQCPPPLKKDSFKHSTKGSVGLTWRRGGNCPNGIGHFTVVCLVTWPLSGSEAGGDLVLIQTLLLFICKCKLVSMRTT